MSIQITRLEGEPPFEDTRDGWLGYHVDVAGKSPFGYWVLGPEFSARGGGYIQRDAEDERLSDSRSPFECDDPHPDEYYDEVWEFVIEDLLRQPESAR